jgi:hypothetical protein
MSNSNFYFNTMISDTLITEFYLILVSTLIFFLIISVWLFYLLNTDLFLEYGLRLVCLKLVVFVKLTFIFHCSFYRSITGLRTRYVARKYGQGVWCYAEKGSRLPNSPTFLFLHGFGGCKDDWPNIIKSIPSTYHCILVDLPGHGETTFLHGHDQPTIVGYADSVKEFLQVIDLDKENQIYLIGYVERRFVKG